MDEAAVAYLQKPVIPAVLLGVMRTVLDDEPFAATVS
jgi:hypothetical protein